MVYKFGQTAGFYYDHYTYWNNVYICLYLGDTVWYSLCCVLIGIVTWLQDTRKLQVRRRFLYGNKTDTIFKENLAFSFIFRILLIELSLMRKPNCSYCFTRFFPRLRLYLRQLISRVPFITEPIFMKIDSASQASKRKHQRNSASHYNVTC